MKTWWNCDAGLLTISVSSSTVLRVARLSLVCVVASVSPELEKCYNFTQLAVELNERETGVAPTDSRLRPDQRLLEDGKPAESDRVKVELEQKQRTARAEREKAAETLGTSKQTYLMMMMMMSGFVYRVINNPQMRYRSAKQVGLQMSSQRQQGESCVSQSGWQTVPDDWACDRETPRP